MKIEIKRKKTNLWGKVTAKLASILSLSHLLKKKSSCVSLHLAYTQALTHIQVLLVRNRIDTSLYYYAFFYNIVVE